MTLLHAASVGLHYAERAARTLWRCPAVALALSLLALSPAAADSPAKTILQHAPDIATQTWQKALLAKHNAGPGCYKAHYPDENWTAVPCVASRAANRTPPLVRREASQELRPETTGNFNDYMALSSSGTESAAGSIIEVDNLTSESDSGFGPGKYSLQMNTNGFTPPASVCASCTGAVQFYYDQNGGGIEVQFWMLNYISKTVTACPAASGWQTSGASCFKNGAACNSTTNQTTAPAPIVPVANLPEVTLTGEADAGGNDTVTLAYGADMVQQSACDAILGLAGKWTATEFNVFGDFNGDAATFNPGVLMTVTISLTDTTADFPACTTVSASSASSTIETTNMNLAACQPTRPGIRFVEGVPPVIGSINPASGSQDGGTPVTIIGATGSPGSGFASPIMGVQFGSSFAVATCSNNQCLADAPKGTGVVPVTVQNLTSTNAAGPPSTQAFSFSYEPFPFGLLSPTQGPEAGGTNVTLSGHNLGLAPGATVVTFDFPSGPASVSAACSAAPGASPEFAQACTLQTPAFPNPPSTGSPKVAVQATVAGRTSPVGAFTYEGPVAPPVTCEQCLEDGLLCVFHNGKAVCECPRSSPTGVCQ